MLLRDYQSDSIVAVQAELAKVRGTFLVLPTGAGKTVVFATIGRDWPTGRVLILAHTEELINQAAQKVKWVTGEPPCIEQAERRALVHAWGGSKIVVASVASLYRDSRLTGEVFGDPSQFGLVVFDEAHRAVKKNTMYARIFNHFSQNPNCRFLGVSATPDRTDKAGLTFFDSIAYELKLRTAIEAGWLVPIRQQYGVCKSIDFRKVRIRCGDFVEADLERVMAEEGPLHEVAGAIIERCAGKKTLVFAAGIHHAERLTEILRERHEMKAVCVHGGNADYHCPTEWRRRRIGEFNRGVHEILVGCDVFYEGFDSPGIENIVIAKKTKSRLRYAQAVGRGTRVLSSVALDPNDPAARVAAIAASAKPHMTVIDLVGCSTELELELPCVADLLLENPSADARRRAKKNAIESGGSRDADADLAAAAFQIETEELERRKRATVIAETRHEWMDVNTFNYRGPVASSDGQFSNGREPTDGQINFLRRNGIDPTGMTRGQAGREISLLKNARNLSRPTEKQRAILDAAGVTATTREHASAIIDVMFATRRGIRQLPTDRSGWTIHELNGEYTARVVCGLVQHPVGEPHKSEQGCRDYIRRLIQAEQQREPAAIPA